MIMKKGLKVFENFHLFYGNNIISRVSVVELKGVSTLINLYTMDDNKVKRKNPIISLKELCISKYLVFE